MVGAPILGAGGFHYLRANRGLYRMSLVGPVKRGHTGLGWNCCAPVIRPEKESLVMTASVSLAVNDTYTPGPMELTPVTLARIG